MRLILRGTANFIVTLILFAIGMYALLWGFFFLLESVQGHSYGGHSAIQLYVAGLLYLCVVVMALAFCAFLTARGWHLVRRSWPPVAKVMINPLLIKSIVRRSWITPAVVTLGVVPPYLAIWGWPNWQYLGFTGMYYLIAFVLLWIPSVIVHELLHAVGWWIISRVPSNQVRFRVLARYGGAYAYTHHDMTVWSGQVAMLLPAILLGIIPAVAGLILQQPLLLAYGLVMVYAAAGDLFLAWHTLKFPATASFNECIEGMTC